MSNLYELCCCPNLARQNHRVLTLLPHSLSSTATSPLSDSYREVGDFGIIAVPFDLGIISLYMSTGSGGRITVPDEDPSRLMQKDKGSSKVKVQILDDTHDWGVTRQVRR